MLNSIKLKFAQSIKNKRLNVFGLFFLLAFLILVVTKLSETYVETVPFRVTYKNLPETSIITTDSIPKVNVTLSTHGFNLLSYYFQDKTYQLDFENNTSINGSNYVWLAEKGTYALKEQLGNSVKIVSVKPDTLLLPFGTLSAKKVPVILNVKLNFAPGYDTLERLKAFPDSVKIIGAAQEISKIDAVETKPLVINDVRTHVDAIVDLEFSNPSEHLKLSEKNIRVKAEVEKFTEGTFEVPVAILNLPEGLEINYFPKYIKVAYYLSLKDYKSTEPSDFKIECNYNDVLKTGASFFTPELVVSSNKVKSARMKQNKVEYIIVK
jgi:YbbR domain-containing protein